MKKLHSCKGETLVEVLISIIVLSLCFIILQTSIVASNRMNKQSKDAVKVFKITDNTTQSSAQVVIKKSDGNSIPAKTGTIVHKTEDGYYYYGE